MYANWIAAGNRPLGDEGELGEIGEGPILQLVKAADVSRRPKAFCDILIAYVDDAWERYFGEDGHGAVMELEDRKLMDSSKEILHQLGFVPIKVRRRVRKRAPTVEEGEEEELAGATSEVEEEGG